MFFYMFLFIFHVKVNGLMFETAGCKPTSHDVYGPYYVPNSPPLTKFCTKDQDFSKHSKLLVHGHVYERDCRTPIQFAKIEVWQADHNGDYTFLSDCRGFLYTDHNGYYELTTIHPGKYSTDFQNHLFRPSHLHFKIHGRQGHRDLVTQMYFYGDSNLGRNDSCKVCSSDRKDLIVKTTELCDSYYEGCVDVAEFNVVLEKGEGTSVTYADYDYEYR